MTDTSSDMAFDFGQISFQLVHVINAQAGSLRYLTEHGLRGLQTASFVSIRVNSWLSLDVHRPTA